MSDLYPTPDRQEDPTARSGVPGRTGGALTLWLVVLLLLSGSRTTLAGSKLEESLGNLYGICLFEKDPSNPFRNAATLSRTSLAPGITGFIESNLASIPLTPPSLKSVFRGGEIVNVISGFTPIFTENSATVGKGRIFVGANFSYYDFNQIRGQELSEMRFTFSPDDLAGDFVAVTMPLDVTAEVYTLYGTYGVTNRLDIGLALPFVSFDIKADGTRFAVLGSLARCGYGGEGPPNCDGEQARSDTPLLGLGAEAVTGVADDELSVSFLSTVALRLKYRLPGVTNLGRVAAVIDLRIPTRSDDSVLGGGDFGTRITLVGEAPTRGGNFTPYINLGAQMWDGDASSSLTFATGFTQLVAEKVSFTFDLLGELQMESDPFLNLVDDQAPISRSSSASAVMESTIPSVGRDHELNTALGLQFAITESLHGYGSALFSLLDRGLHSNIVPTVGLAFHY